MNVDVDVNGRAYGVAVERTARSGEFAVNLNGRARTVDVSWIDADTLSVIDGHVSREVRVHQREDGILDIAVGGRAFVALLPKRSQILSQERGGGLGATATSGRDFIPAGPHPIKAPMSGRIVRVLVSRGDPVTPRQPVVIVEAMKMENELRSSGTGVVKEVNVHPGDAIDTGTVLLVIEYAAPI